MSRLQSTSFRSRHSGRSPRSAPARETSSRSWGRSRPTGAGTRRIPALPGTAGASSRTAWSSSRGKARAEKRERAGSRRRAGPWRRAAGDQRAIPINPSEHVLRGSRRQFTRPCSCRAPCATAAAGADQRPPDRSEDPGRRHRPLVGGFGVGRPTWVASATCWRSPTAWPRAIWSKRRRPAPARRPRLCLRITR